MQKIGFEALIQQVAVKSLRTGDRSLRITLEVDSPGDPLLKALAGLQRADKLVGVAIAKKET